MSRYLVQHETTDPARWESVEATSLRVAAATVAARHGPGFVTVYAASSEAGNLHPNGAPIRVSKVLLTVNRRAVPIRCT